MHFFRISCRLIRVELIRIPVLGDSLERKKWHLKGQRIELINGLFISAKESIDTQAGFVCFFPSVFGVFFN